MPDRVLITGSTRGLGLAMTKIFLEQGHYVFAGARNLGRASELHRLQENTWKGGFCPIDLDVLDEGSVNQAARELGAHTERLDILINNAGIHPERGDESFAELNLDFFAAAFATNVVGVARCCRAFASYLQKSSCPRVINLSSGSGSISNRDNHRRYCYGASKAALNHLTRSLAHDWQKQGVAVVAISPGWVKTDMGGPEAPLEIEEAARSMVRTILKISPDQTGMFLDRNGGEDTYSW